MQFSGLRAERMRASAQYHEGRFRNANGETAQLKGNQLAITSDFLFGGSSRKPPGRLPMLDPRAAWQERPAAGLRASWLGHSTVLLELDGVRVLTDPVFGDRASPVSFAGPKRFHAPPVGVEELPELDAIVLSHDHYDHLCAGSVRALAQRCPLWITALGVGARLEALGVPAERIVELDWWESHELAHAELRVTATPAQHFSGRGVGDRNQTLWASWALRSRDHHVFFSGDTGLCPAFSDITARLGRFDLTMLEIGAWHPAWGSIHLGPHNALQAFEALGGGCLLPVHWATFDLGLHPWAEPIEGLVQEASERGQRVITPQLGEVFEPARDALQRPWWRELPR